MLLINKETNNFGLHYLSLYFGVRSIYLSRKFNKPFYVDYLMLISLRVFSEDLLIQAVAFLFQVLILYSKFIQFRFVFINKIDFLELKICPKYLTEILKVLTESFSTETFSTEIYCD